MKTPLTLSRLFLFAACLCFAVALLLAVGALTGSSGEAWQDGGLFALALSLAIP